MRKDVTTTEELLGFGQLILVCTRDNFSGYFCSAAAHSWGMGHLPHATFLMSVNVSCDFEDAFLEALQ